MSQSALAALLGQKPAASQTAAATPVVKPAASPAPASQPTPPVPAAAQSQPLTPPASSPAASSSTAAASPVSPGPNASNVPTPQGGPNDTLAGLLGEFKANAGKLPQVNPPQAAAVLSGATAKEVAGHPEPEKAPEEKIAPTEKPAAVLAAEQAGKTRRTAAVVQVELDAALKRIAELEALLGQRDDGTLEALRQRVVELEGQLQAQADSIAAAAAGGSDQATLIEAVDMIKSLQGEAAVQLEDNRKAWARVAELEEQLEGVSTGEHPAPARELKTLRDVLDALQAQLGPGQSVTVTGLA